MTSKAEKARRKRENDARIARIRAENKRTAAQLRNLRASDQRVTWAPNR